MECFLKRAKTWTHVNYLDLSSSQGDYVQKNFPDVQVIFSDWDEVCDDLRINDYLDVAFDLLEKYNVLSPKTTEEWSLSFDVREFLAKSQRVIDEDNLKRLQVKAVMFFYGLGACALQIADGFVQKRCIIFAGVLPRGEGFKLFDGPKATFEKLGSFRRFSSRS